MAKFTKGVAFSADEQLTHTKLNNLVDDAEFDDDAVDDSTTELSSGAIIVKTGGITASQLGANAVETLKINNSAVIRAKIAADSIDGTKLADNAVNSEHYTDGSIDKEHLGATVISGQTELAAIPHLTEDFVLISDDDVLKKISLMKYLPLPRAYGIIKMDGTGGTADATGLYGCSCSAYSGTATGSYTFDLSVDMSSTNYVILTQGHNTTDWGDGTDTAAVEIVDEGQFKIHAITNTGLHVSFAVFGTLV